MNKYGFSYLIIKLGIFVILINCIGCATGTNWTAKCVTSPMGEVNLTQENHTQVDLTADEEAVIMIPGIRVGAASTSCVNPNHRIIIHNLYDTDKLQFKYVHPSPNYDNEKEFNAFTSYCITDYKDDPDPTKSEWQTSLSNISEDAYPVSWYDEQSHHLNNRNCECRKDVNMENCSTESGFFFKVRINPEEIGNLSTTQKIDVSSNMSCIVEVQSLLETGLV